VCHWPGNLLACHQWKVKGASQQRKTAAVRAKQVIKLAFAVSSEIAPFIIKQTLLLYLFLGEEGGVAQCD